ncbi:cation:proton antiporter [Ramlibacter alkalitolerans]|uniref:Sodium:proton antiporter n=1 Tax=Ramlibacter alkalitolerans TaxID=2039631 RepID=A0ABS1JVS8_9BURK|nr:sodium:proton antiporter [Ramlibacter alkalitolerans]MBL0428297.1 sodium:proton antiporter [Ramlibacter alkalitolerans]
MSFLDLLGALLTAVAVLGYVNYRVVRLPDTIGITAMGLLVSLLLVLAGNAIPGATAWARELAGRFDFPELVLHGLLSVLLFAGSLHLNIAELARMKLPVLVLSTVGVVLSMLLVGYGAWWVLRAIGLDVPLKYCLLFGALISPTDPIAVLGVLKTVGVPRTLEVEIAGESLFNDGTGVVAFLVMLGIATGSQEPTAASIALLLVEEIAGAVLLGLVLGYGAFLMLRGVDSYAVEIIITLALATAGYSLAEHLHVSAPITVVVVGLVIGNHGAKHAMSETTRQHLFSFWDLIDEVLNLVLFGMVGLQLLAFAGQQVSYLAAILLVPVVLAARFLSVGLPAVVLGRWLRNRSPHGVKVLTWAGLRGGISVAMALSLPAFEGRDTLVLGTYAVVLFSLLVQAPTLGWYLRRLGVRAPAPAAAAASVQTRA